LRSIEENPDGKVCREIFKPVWWTGSDEEKRRLTSSFRDLAPGQEMQIGLARVTGSTEAGILSFYMTELQAQVLSDAFYNDA